jgi:hypothetical protein
MSQQAIQAATTPTSPRKAPKPKPFPVTTKLEHGGRYQTAILQHGLTTAPVRLENRNVDKYAQMPFGFGDMKQMQSSGKSKFEKSLLPPKIRN